MKKRTLIVAAMLAAMTVGANAQENLALNKTTYASSNETKTSLSVDGNTGTRWEPNGETGDQVNDANHFWYTVDLAEEKEFNLVKVMWENTYIKGFQILVSNDNDTWTKVYEQSGVAVESGKFTTYNIGDQKARYVKVWATDLSNSTYFSFWELQVMKAETSELTTVVPSAFFVKTGEATDLSLAYADQYGNEMTCDGATFDVMGGTYENGKLTATVDGKVTIKATYEGKTIETTVYAVGNAPELNLDKTNNVYYGIYGADALNCEHKAAWNTAWNEPTDIKLFENEINIDGTPAIQVGNIRKLLLGKSNGNGGTDAWGFQNTDGYTNAAVAIFPDRDVHATFTIEGGKSAEKDLKGGEWNYITVSDLATTDTYKYFDIFANEVDGSYPNMLISNVYLYGPKHTTSVLTSATPSVSFVKNEESDLTFTCYDQYNKEMGDCTVTTEDGTYADGKFTPNKTGKATFTITSGESTVQTSVYVMGENEAPVLSLNKDAYDYKGLYGASELGCDNSQVGWESGYRDATVVGEMTIGTTPAMQLSKLNKILVGNSSNGELGITNEDGYTDVTIAVFSDRDATTSYRIEANTEKAETVQLEAGKWCYFTISGFTTETTFKYIDLENTTATDGSRPNVLISNIYFSKAKSGEPTDPDKLVIDRDVTSANGYLKVTGKLTAENKSELESADLADVTAFDLSNVTFEEGVGALTFANPNAMIQVAGTVENNVGILSDNAKNIEGTPNMVVRNTWYFPVSKIILTDGNPVWTQWFISTGDTGYEYTRNVTAGKWITITSPANIYELPDGLLVYEAAESTEANTIAFNKVTTIAAHTPYIAYAKNDLTITAEGTRDLDMEASKQQSKSLGNGLTLNSTYAGVTGSEGKYYGIYAGATGRDENTLKLQRLGETAKLGAFRAYISVPTSQNISEFKVLINDGTETAIYNIQTTDNMKSVNGIYSVDGRLVRKNTTSTEGLAKGVYVVNGKKVVIK